MSSRPDFLTEYVALNSGTEAPLYFHRWCGISLLGAALERNFWVPHGPWNLYMNHYVMIVAEAASRKSVAIKAAKRFLAGVAYDKFSASQSSKEKFLDDLAIPHGSSAASDLDFGGDAVSSTDPAAAFIVSDEFNRFITGGGDTMGFLSLLGDFWDWDQPDGFFTARYRKSESVKIFQPTLSLLGGNTHTGMAEIFPIDAFGQGFMSRLICITGEPSGQRITWPEPLNEQRLAACQEMIQAIMRVVRGEAVITPEARDLLDTIYQYPKPPDDERLMAFHSRKFTHLLKLCGIIAASKITVTIDEDIVREANTLMAVVEHEMPQAFGEFGTGKHSALAHRIVQALTKGVGLTRQQLFEKFSRELNSPNDLDTLLITLGGAKKIQSVKLPNGDHGYLPVMPIFNANQPGIDFTNLPELEVKYATQIQSRPSTQGSQRTG